MKNGSIYSAKITFLRLLAFTAPTVLMTLIQASYSMIDGVFIANFLGEQALSALTLISPYFNFFMAAAAMFASGGSAVVMKKMGEGRVAEGRRDFTTLTFISALTGLLLSILFLIFTKPLVDVFGAAPSVAAQCREYLHAYSFFIIPQLLFSILQIFTIAAGESMPAMLCSLLGGAVNILLDYLLIGRLRLGMGGAAAASGLGMLIPCVFLAGGFLNRKKFLHFASLRFDIGVFRQTVLNGVSEFASNFVSGIVMLLFNARMLSMAGEDGVAASTVTFYVFGLASALYMGYMFGIAPLLSFFYGAGEKAKIIKIKRISLILIGIVGTATTFVSVAGSRLLVTAFTRPGGGAYALAVNGNRLFSTALLFVGFNTFASMLFTAFSNARVSAVIAFSRTFVLLSAAILILPSFLGMNGLWLSVPVSEGAALLLSLYFLRKYGKEYGC